MQQQHHGSGGRSEYSNEGIYPPLGRNDAEPTGSSSFSSNLGNVGFSGSGLGSMNTMQSGYSRSSSTSSAPSMELLSALQSNTTRGSAQTSNMSDFPSLSSQVANMSLTASTTFGGVRYPKAEEFVIQKEDFPALSSFGSGVASSNDALLQGSTSRISSSIGSRATGNSSTNMTGNATYSSTDSPVANMDSSFKSGPAHGISNRARDQSGSFSNDANLGDQYGLLGLLSVVRMTNKDLNTLALGLDLTTLGLNLNSTESLHSTFASPWAETQSGKEPQFNLPMCYYMQPPALKTSHLSKFQLETLFYIFYAIPNDVLQAYAAQELYTREWRYHMDLKLWFKHASAADGFAGQTGSQYIYFDINLWDRCLFAGNIGGINTGFLSEDDVRVKFQSTAN